MMLLRKGALLLLVLLAMYLGAFLLLTRVEVGGVPLIFRTADHYYWKGGDTWQRFDEYDPARRHDVVVMGSSHAYRGYDPALFAAHGLDMFNLGSSAQTAMNTRYLAEAYLHAGNTGLLVLEVSKSFLEDEGLESTADLVQNNTSGHAARRMAFALRDPRGVNMLVLRWMMQGHAPQYLSENYAGRGYCRYDERNTAQPLSGRSGSFDPLPEQVAQLEALIAWAQEQGIPLVLVTHPIPASSVDRARHIAFVDFMGELLRERGVKHIDMGLDHDLDDHLHFADHSHLNQAGVEIFVPRLIERLRKEGMLPPVK